MPDLIAMRNALDTDGDGLISLEELLKLAQPDRAMEIREVRRKLMNSAKPYFKAAVFLMIRYVRTPSSLCPLL
mgnify:CR=1 FL=1